MIIKTVPTRFNIPEAVGCHRFIFHYPEKNIYHEAIFEPPGLCTFKTNEAGSTADFANVGWMRDNLETMDVEIIKAGGSGCIS